MEILLRQTEHVQHVTPSRLLHSCSPLEFGTENTHVSWLDSRGHQIQPTAGMYLVLLLLLLHEMPLPMPVGMCEKLANSVRTCMEAAVS